MCILCVAAAGVAQAGVAVAKTSQRTGIVGVAPHYVASFVKPVLFTINGISINSFGTLVGLALLAGYMVILHDLKAVKVAMEERQEVCGFMSFSIGALVGGKSHYVLSAIFNGTFKLDDLKIGLGLSFLGSQVGAFLGMVVFIRWMRLPIGKIMDVILPCILLGHAIGKIGCFLSGDGCYGPEADPSEVPWAMSFPNGLEPIRVPVHPTPLYECIVSFVSFLAVRILLPLPQPKAASWRRTGLTLVLLGIARIALERYRRHPGVSAFLGLTEFQALAALVSAIGVLMELWVRAKLQFGWGEKEDEEEDETAVSNILHRPAKSLKGAKKKKA